MMTAKHVDKLKNGRLRFRRRFPKDVAEALEKSHLQVHLKNSEGAAFQREYAGVLREFDRIVRETRQKAVGFDPRSPNERWHAALLKAEGMVEETTGFLSNEYEARQLLAEGLEARGEDPLLVKAVLQPSAKAPEATLQDARNIYLQERVKDDRPAQLRTELMCRRVSEVLGPLDKVVLTEFRREHGRKVRDHLLSITKDNGEPRAVKSIHRELIILTAMVNLGIRELDLEGKASNPFSNLELPKDETRAVDKRLPLTDDLVDRMQAKLDDGRNVDLQRAWALLSCTGCRLAEVSGLERRDIDLSGPVPCLHVRPNGVRRLKTDASVRSVPLFGRALEVAREVAAEGGDGTSPVFARYDKPRGADNLSAILNKHLRTMEGDKRMTAYGCRHRVSDKLRAVNTPVEVRDRILGHASGSIGATVYGSAEVRLKVDAEWIEKALHKQS